MSRTPAVLLLMATTAGCASWPFGGGGATLLSRADHQAREGAWEDAVTTYDEYLARYSDTAAAPRALESRDTLAAMLVARSELTRLRAEVMQLRAELAQLREDMTRREGDLVHLVGLDGRYPEAEEVRAAYPAPVTSALMSCRAIHENAIIHSPDTETAGVLPPEGLRLARLSGFRSVVAVPMRREGVAVGALGIANRGERTFTEDEVARLSQAASALV